MECLRNITKLDVIDAVQRASRRIVYLAPGLDEEVASVLASAWKRIGPDAVTVILDIDPEVIRLGYGTLAGLENIQAAAAGLGQAVCHQPGIRICVAIADETSLIFSPTPLLIEAGSPRSDMPNGIALASPPKSLGDELGIGAGGIEKRTIGMTVVRPQSIEAVKKDLAENPPLRFDISRKERVFNSKLEFVEFELEGCFVSRHTVTIPPDLVGMAGMEQKTRDKLRSSFRLIGQSDILDAKKKISEKALSDERSRIARKYLVPIKGYGTVILRSNRDAFEADVEALRAMVVAFREALRGKLAAIYSDNVERLTKALLPAVAKNPPENWTSVLGAKPEKKAVADQLAQTLLRSFGDPEVLLREMKVNLVFKGVTYGTLVSKEFVEKAEAAFPQMKLMEEFAASRGHETAAPKQPDLFGS